VLHWHLKEVHATHVSNHIRALKILLYLRLQKFYNPTPHAETSSFTSKDLHPTQH
jgi:hypothetical protein